ncbi:MULTISPECIES: adhesin [unclassified Streptomyces]|uniref:adhesin n=1 Tax=unclassified Streptomyces TaxID=2593676 RepID=UPI003630E52A
MCDTAAGGPERHAAHDDGRRSRKRPLVTVAVVALALGTLGATLALVTGSGDSAGGGGVSGAGGAGAGGIPTRIGPPELPGLGGGGSSAPPAPSQSAPPAAPPTVAPTASASAPPTATHDPDGPGYSAWAGPGCASGEYTEHGRFENGDAAWYTVTDGGYEGGSCDGRFSAVPMSGSPAQDRGSTATWSWKLGKAYEQCALAVYVPDSGRPADTAGHPTVYRVLRDPADTSSAYAAFGVRQTAHRGSLVSVGSYRVEGESFSVQLLDRGRDWGGEDRYGAHHAAAQMNLNCT